MARRIYASAHLTGTFTLRSGRVSQEYFDKYRFEALAGEGLTLHSVMARVDLGAAGG